MTDAEKLIALQTAILPDTADDLVLADMLQVAAAQILNRMYPFGYIDGTTIPPRYERLQVELAVELFTKRGAEGQASHTENGTTRTWATESQLLRRIMPLVGSVMTDA